MAKLQYRIPLTFEDKEFLLISYKDNYADEFDVNGFTVLDSEQWIEFQNNIPKDSFIFSFGTNESIDYESKKEFLKTFTVKPISIEQAKTLFALFGRSDTKCSGWNGTDYNKVIHFTKAEYGMFPSYIGEAKDDDII